MQSKDSTLKKIMFKENRKIVSIIKRVLMIPRPNKVTGCRRQDQKTKRKRHCLVLKAQKMLKEEMYLCLKIYTVDQEQTFNLFDLMSIPKIRQLEMVESKSNKCMRKMIKQRQWYNSSKMPEK